jgi:DNA-binding NarL/FixJ family response regulator
MATRVLIADDHPILRQGLKDLVQKEGYLVVAECGDGHQAVRSAEKSHPEVAILDFSMPCLNGLDAARCIQQSCPDTKTIILSMHQDEPYVQASMRAGVRGYVLKADAATGLVRAIREVCQGHVYLSPGVCRAIVDACRSEWDGSLDTLSPREREFVGMIADGRTTREIAERLNITIKSAEFYRSALMDKLEIHDTAHLVRYAIRAGIVQL